ncbi:unnamed protein product [Allacma fusca]|uniref:Rap guanine nucleotide exchange factor 2 n=1 Tax=Allacma fusca TaxID=39272 RepID=A0A8J2JMC5_9HEXA|nr:unnamed protein product [Allacma fusca]
MDVPRNNNRDSKSSFSSVHYPPLYTNPTSVDALISNQFLRALKRDPGRRSTQDIEIIYATLRSFDCLLHYDHEAFMYISENGVLLNREANEILYCRGEVASNWFILLSGSVFIDGSMFVPITTFGRRPGTSTRRNNECLILEQSDMISVEYIEHGNNSHSAHHQNRSSHSSDTSSAYSGSDTMGSSVPSDEVDLSGLVESVVDSDDDDEDIDSIENVNVRDAVRECLEKDPSERTGDDINTLLEFTQHLDAFKDMTISVRRALCTVMVFAVVDKAGTTVLSHGEELDSWSVVVHGSVQVTKHNGETEVYYAGKSFGQFGTPPTLDKQFFSGSMQTVVDDCQFVCVTQSDYYRILKQGEDSQTIHRDNNNQIILVTELKQIDGGSRCGHVVIRGTVEQLMSQLVSSDQPSVDPTYVEDYLLTQRIFCSSETLATKLINWFGDKIVRDRVTRVVLLWVNNHFIDFETSKILFGFLLKFQAMLENCKDMSGQLRLLQIACSAKSRPRHLTLTRASRDDPLPFNIMGGADNGYGIYVNHVDAGSKVEELGLRRGDEILETNGQSFKSISLSKAFEILKGATHLFLTVKCNFLGYHECINSTIPLMPNTLLSDPQMNLNYHPSMNHMMNQMTKTTLGPPSSSLSYRHRFKMTLMKIHLLPKKPISHDDANSIDLPNNHYENPCNSTKIDFPENVLKVYRSDQSFKYLLVNKETNARQVVMLALQEFQDLATHDSREYALFQVSAVGGILKQRRLPDTMDSLAERIPLGARYYIKRRDSSEPLVQTEQIPELTKEGDVTFLHLNPVELAFQLTLEDYAIFRQIEMTEFIDDLFRLDSPYGTPNLNAFEELVNRETYWVVTEVTREINVNRRVQILKRFIKVATQVKDCRNFNSMFAIVSGLGHNCVSRLKNTWDKLPGKYQKLFQDMQNLMDPSRNMGRYRALLSQSNGQTPMIPFYPVVRKDLTFINEGNSTFLENLVNFEKMRMMSREIRQLVQMSAAPFDTSSQPAIAAMNQITGPKLTTTTGKRRKKSQGPPNPKKMYEEANMIRKVKAYLHKLSVVTDENVLFDMSCNCESPSLGPGGGGAGGSTSSGLANAGRSHGSGSGSSRNNRVPSPSPSTTSSNSSDSNRVRKFGTGSPGSYQKLLSLSEPKTRVYAKTSNSSSNNSPPGSLRRYQLNNNTSVPDKILLSVESSSVLPAVPAHNANSKESDDKVSSV